MSHCERTVTTARMRSTSSFPFSVECADETMSMIYGFSLNLFVAHRSSPAAHRRQTQIVFLWFNNELLRHEVTRDYYRIALHFIRVEKLFYGTLKCECGGDDCPCDSTFMGVNERHHSRKKRTFEIHFGDSVPSIQRQLHIATRSVPFRNSHLEISRIRVRSTLFAFLESWRLARYVCYGFWRCFG